MKIKCLVLLISFIIYDLKLQCQDIHFVDYRPISSFFNPAQTGDFLGNIKVSGGYRNQYASIYSTFVGGGQMNIQSPLRKNDWIGVGVNFNFDKSGSLSLNHLGMALQASYMIGLDKKQKSYIGVGTGVQFNNYSLNTDKYNSETTIRGLIDPDKTTFNNFATNFISMDAGILLRLMVAKNDYISTGIAAKHINQPEFTIVSKDKLNSIDIRYNAHFLWHKHINNKIYIEPTFYFSHSEYTSNTNIQVVGGYRLLNKKDLTITSGMSYRIGDAVGILMGMQWSGWQFHLNLDLIADEKVNYLQNPGAAEICMSKIINLNSTPKIQPILFCPRL